jgi:hypothetical protein
MLCSFILVLLFVTGSSWHEGGRLSKNEAANYFGAASFGTLVFAQDSGVRSYPLPSIS